MALATQTSLENFIGGIALFADRPVRVGDTCKFGDKIGTVERIGMRSTRMRTPERTLVSIPNGEFWNEFLEVQETLYLQYLAAIESSGTRLAPPSHVHVTLED